MTRPVDRWRAAVADPEKLMDEIVVHISAGRGLLSFVQERGFTYCTAYDWIAADTTRLQAYRDARLCGAHALFEEAAQILDEPPRLTPEGKVDNGYVAWQRARSDIRKWQASKLLPRIYGDSLSVESRHLVEFDIRALLALREGRLQNLGAAQTDRSQHLIEHEPAERLPPPTIECAHDPDLSTTLKESNHD